MSHDPNIAIIPARCGQTSLRQLGFDIVLEERRSSLWYLIGTTTVAGGTGSKAGLEPVEIRGTFDIDQTYPGCPHCTNKEIFQCGNCHRICCWNGVQYEVTCRWCGHDQVIAAEIESISGSSAPDQKTTGPGTSRPGVGRNKPSAHPQPVTYQAYRTPRRPHAPSAAESIQNLIGHDGPVWCVAWGADANSLASGGKDGTIRLWRVQDGTQRYVFNAHADGVRTIALHGTGLFSGGVDAAVARWDATTGQACWRAHKHQGNVFGLSLAPDGQSLVTGAKDGTLCFWRAADGHLSHRISAHSDWVWTVAWSPAGSPIASGSVDRTVCCWNSEQAQKLVRFKMKTDKIRSVAFHPDGQHLAVGCYDRTVHVLNVNTREDTLVLRGHAGTVRTVTFHPVGTLLASAGSDGIVRVYDLKTGHERQRLTIPGIVYGVAFSPDGQSLAVGSADGVVRLWRGEQWQ